MYQSLIEKTSECLIPVMFAGATWFGVHYSVLTPRIVMADLPKQYAEFDANESLPEEIRNCFLDNLVPETLTIGRFDAAIYTASFKYVAQPYVQSLKTVEDNLDDQCGISITRQRLVEEAEQRRQLALIAETKRLEEEAAERIRLAAKEAERQALQLAEQVKQEALRKQAEFGRALSENPETAILNLVEKTILRALFQ